MTQEGVDDAAIQASGYAVRSQGSDSADAESLFFKLVRLVNLTARPFRQRVGEPNQLSLNEWRVMAVLGDEAGATATRLVERTGLDKMTVSRALGGLRKAGRMRRHDDPTDQRRSRLYLTSAGKTLFVHARELGAAREAELFADISVAEKAALAATLDKLIAAVLRADS